MKQSERSVGKAYSQLMDKLSCHVTLLAKNGKPITSVMGIKRGLYRYKRELTTPLSAASPIPPPSCGHLPKGRIALAPEIVLLANDVLDKFDVDVLGAVEVGLVVEKDLKRALIKYYYERMAKEGKTYKDIKKVLSERYGVSVSSIEKLVYGN